MPPKKRMRFSNRRNREKGKQRYGRALQESTEVREHRPQNLATCAATNRPNETDAKRAERLHQMADRARHRRKNETKEQRTERLNEMADRATHRRENETEEKRVERLKQMADREATVRANEDDEQKIARLERKKTIRQRNRHNNPSYLAALNDSGDDMVQEHDAGKLSHKCRHCGALNFVGEKVGDDYTICCHKGKISLPQLRVPDFLKKLLEKNDRTTRAYLDKIRMYNSSFAFASLGVQIEPPPGTGPYVFRIHGQMYHYIGGLHPNKNETPRYGSLYIMDASQALEQRMSYPQNVQCSPEMMQKLQGMLEEISPHVLTWRHAYEVEKDAIEKARQEGKSIASVRMFMRYNVEKRYHDPTAHEEVAAVFVARDGEPPQSRDIVVHSRTNGLQKLPNLSPLTDPLTYPLLFPYGEFGFEVNMPHTRETSTAKRNRVTLLQFYCYRISVREGFSLIHASGKLFQQFVVDAYVKWEGNNLQWIKLNQTNLRAEKYSGLMDHVNNLGQESGCRIGKIVILPSSFIGSPRNMSQNYQDAMAIVGKFGKPDLFITFTSNPKWREIVENMAPWQRVEHRPDLVSRVFALKLKELMGDLTKNHVFGVVVAYLYVIEFQKRGLPHAHILLFLQNDDKLRDAENIDCAVCAEIPDVQSTPKLHQIVKACMIHGPCGELNRSSPCMEDGKCSKKFPKDFANKTNPNVDGYPVYRRRESGITVVVKGHEIDNRWVVPYNPFLSLKYNAHINVEVCSSIKSVKYIFKYVYKGYDCAQIQIDQRVPNVGENGQVVWDEISTHLDARYVSAPESVWRLHENHMHKQSHTIVRLAVHLPMQQMVVFVEGEEREAAERAASRDTTLTAWFKLNLNDENARCILYKDIPEHYVWVHKDKHWKQRQRGGDAVIGRMFSVSPKDTERYFLRMLLLHVQGATCFQDLRTVDGVMFETFREAAIKKGLLANDEEWRECLQEATTLAMPYQMRQMFAYICLFCTPSFPASLFEQFKEALSEDYIRRTGDVEASINTALMDIKSVIVSNGMDYSKLGLPSPKEIALSEEAIDYELESVLAADLTGQMNEHQQVIVEEILDCVRNNKGGAFFIDGPGGTGKTFVYRCLIHTIKSQRLRILPVAFTGIAGNLLIGGRTAHSAFKLPVPLLENSVSNIQPNSHDAEKLRKVDLIIWDEASMAPATAFGVVDRLLRDICNKDALFGGKVVVLGGDFRQVLPVVPHSDRAAIVEACIKRSPIWPQLSYRRLSRNMRANPEERSFADFLLELGNGTLQCETSISADAIRLPDECISNGNLLDHVFGTRISMENLDDVSDCAILCPKNSDCDVINEDVVSTKLLGNVRVYASADSIVSDNEEEIDNYPLEFLNTLTPSGMPPHKLKLKPGVILILLRNLNVQKGLVNGARMVVRGLHSTNLDVEVLTGNAKGTRVLIPRIDLTSSDTNLPFILKRRQFPVKLAFAITINKAQGQTFRKIGLYLPAPVFTHGQLYVAFSRVRRLADIKVAVDQTSDQGKFAKKSGTYTSNVVFREVLQ